MPIRPENRARYPKDWPAISHAIRERAGWRCEECGVKNGERGGRSPSGRFHAALPTGTNGFGHLTWPREGTHHWCVGYDIAPLRIIRIVLTVAHLDHHPENCDPANLRALCQRCHLRYDAASKRQRQKARQRQGAALGDLLTLDTPPAPPNPRV